MNFEIAEDLGGGMLIENDQDGYKKMVQILKSKNPERFFLTIECKSAISISKGKKPPIITMLNVRIKPDMENIGQGSLSFIAGNTSSSGGKDYIFVLSNNGGNRLQIKQHDIYEIYHVVKIECHDKSQSSFKS